jgi:DUF1680 family protein
VLRGHAVRALYLAAGAADVAVDDADEELLAAVTRQLLATLARRTYITGGMGAHHEGESFGADYELPPDRAYAETCAGVASVMLNHRLLLANRDPVHADAIERVLFNVVATSPAADGSAFFYTNPLQQSVPGTVAASAEPSPRAASSLRAPWFEVSCCPTNVARTLSSLGAYVGTVSDEGLQIHQYADADIRTTLPGGQPVAVRVRTRYPDDGLVEVTIVESPPTPWTLSLRVPGWATAGATVTVGEQELTVAPGYADVRERLTTGDVVQLMLPMDPRWVRPHPRIDAIRGTVAVERGPVVMCMESVDLGESVTDVRVDTSTQPRDADGVTRVRATTVDVPTPPGRIARISPRPCMLTHARWPSSPTTSGPTVAPRRCACGYRRLCGARCAGRADSRRSSSAARRRSAGSWCQHR